MHWNTSVETGLYYCNFRYYSPELCRWISPDDVDYLDPESVNGLNLYCYCYNNPINYADPSGHNAIIAGLIIGAIVGATIGFGTAAYIDYKDDGQIFNGSVAWYDYLGATVLAGLGIMYIIPKQGGVPNSVVSENGSVGVYDENGNLISRTDTTHSHYIKELGDYYNPHTHKYVWKFIKGAWRIVKKIVLPY